jgi:hypothetical protein
VLRRQLLCQPELFVRFGQAVQEEGPGNCEQLRNSRVRQLVGHGIGGAHGGHHLVPAKRGKVLGEVRGFEAGLGQEVTDGRGFLRSCGKKFKDPDTGRVRQAFEEVCLDLVQRGLG